MQELTSRDREILRAIVEEYIATGEPIGSRTVSKRLRLDLSAATIRNVMSDLEEAGYLEQPHTSAGRVPSAQCFRLYVDNLLPLRQPTVRERSLIDLALPEGAMTAQLQSLSRTLAVMTQHASLAVTPAFTPGLVSNVAFVRIGAGRLLAVLASESGVLFQRVVLLDFDLQASELEKVQNYLGELLAGLSLVQVRHRIETELDRERSRLDELAHKALQLAQRVVPADSSELMVEGASHIVVHPDFSNDRDELRKLLRTLDEKTRLMRVLTEVVGHSTHTTVRIGPEMHLLEVHRCSLVAAPFGRAQHGGTVGVLGPMRMDYARVVPLVAYTAEAMSRALGRDS